MHIHVQLTEDIINQSLALHYHTQPEGIKLKRRLLWIPLVLFAIAAYLIYSELQKPEVGQNFYMALLYISFAIIYYFFMRHRMMRSGGKLLKNLGENATFDVELENEEMKTITKSNVLITKLDSFTGALMNADVVLLYQANHSFSMFHRSFFRAGDFELFKNTLKQHVHPAVDIA